MADAAAALVDAASALAWADMVKGDGIGMMDAKVGGMGGSGSVVGRQKEEFCPLGLGG